MPLWKKLMRWERRSSFLSERKILLIFLCIAIPLLILTGCNDRSEVKEEIQETENTEDTQGDVQNMELKMTINETDVAVAWEDNESVDALKELARDGLKISMSMYGGFEQVGPIGQSLPRSDRQTTTSAGDIVLYSGDQIVVFYGSNSWSYTRLGKITDKSDQELSELLGNKDVTIKLELAE